MFTDHRKFLVRIGASLFGAIGSLLTLYVATPAIVKYMLSIKVVLQPGSEIWEPWISAEVPVYSNLYMFNVTNPDAILRGEKPVVQEMGPYVYQVHRVKEHIEFDQNDTVVSYRDMTKLYFRPEMSNGSESDVITTVNIPYVATARILSTFGGTFQKYLAFKVYLNSETLFVRHPVKKLIWDGVDVAKYVALLKLSPLSGIVVPKQYITDDIMDGLFGLAEAANKTGENMTVLTGLHGTTSKLGHILEWNGHSGFVDNWGHPTCNQINGTDSRIYAPLLSRSEKIFFFLPKFCRSLYWSYVEDVNFKGIPGYRYTMPPELFEYGERNPDNWCYCPLDEECPPNGIFNATLCLNGPFLYSHPHLAQADPELLNEIDGLHPDPSKHVSFIDLDPTTGAFLRAHGRMQLNIDVQPFDDIPGFETLNKMIIPSCWMDEYAELDDKLSNALYYNSVQPMIIFTAVCWVAFAVATVAMFVSTVVWLRGNSKIGVEFKDEMYYYSPQTDDQRSDKTQADDSGLSVSDGEEMAQFICCSSSPNQAVDTSLLFHSS